MNLESNVIRAYKKSLASVFYPADLADELNIEEQFQVSSLSARVLSSVKKIVEVAGLRVESEDYSCYYGGRNKCEVSLRCEWNVSAYDDHSSLIPGYQDEDVRQEELKELLVGTIAEHLMGHVKGHPHITVDYQRTGVDDDMVNICIVLKISSLLG